MPKLLGNILIGVGALVLVMVLLFFSGVIKLIPGGERLTPKVNPSTIATTAIPPQEGTTPARPSQMITAFPSSTPTLGANSVLSTLPATPIRRAPAVRLRLPSLGIDAPVVEVGWQVVSDKGTPRAEWETAAYAAGHHIDSANPGEAGNVVISGHHNIQGEVFKGLWNAKKGDETFLYAQDGAVFRYVVAQDALILAESEATEAQRLANARYMDPTADSRVTLITCWPPTGNTHRVIVIGLLAP